jgi:hypothetical protein
VQQIGFFVLYDVIDPPFRVTSLCKISKNLNTACDLNDQDKRNCVDLPTGRFPNCDVTVAGVGFKGLHLFPQFHGLCSSPGRIKDFEADDWCWLIVPFFSPTLSFCFFYGPGGISLCCPGWSLKLLYSNHSPVAAF